MQTIKRIAGAGSDFVIRHNQVPVVTGSNPVQPWQPPAPTGPLKLHFTLLQDDGTLLTYDASTGAFTSGPITKIAGVEQDFILANYQKSSNGTNNIGAFTAVVPGSGFVDGKRYAYHIGFNSSNLCAGIIDFTLEA